MKNGVFVRMAVLKERLNQLKRGNEYMTTIIKNGRYMINEGKIEASGSL